MSRFDRIVYISGSRNPQIIGPSNDYHLHTTNKGLLLFYSKSSKIAAFSSRKKQELLPWANIENVSIDRTLIPDTAVDRILRSRNIVTTLQIKYKNDSGDISTLVITTPQAEKIKGKIDRKIERK